MSDTTEAKWRELLRCASRVDPVEGSDLAAHAWLSLREQFTHRPPHFLMGTVRNLRRNLHRKNRRRRLREQQWADATAEPSDDPAQSLERDEILHALRRLLRSLSPEQRALVAQRYIADRSSAQIAEALQSTSNTVRWRLKTVIDQLRTRLTEFMEPSMPATPELLTIVEELERQLHELSDTWSGRLVVHLAPTASVTRVEKLEFLPPGPPGANAKLKRRLRGLKLPGCSNSRPFEMHFECSPDTATGRPG